MKLKTNLKEGYNPLYFLASLGNGGLSVSMFIYLMFMIEHPKTPLATFGDVYPVLTSGGIASILVSISILGIIYFAYGHFRLLVWNVKEYKLYKSTEAYTKLKTSNAEVTLMAIPLTFAMTVNVCFVLGALFVPGLWSIVEYLFPGAIIAFLVVGYYAMKIFMEYALRLFLNGDFDFVQNSNLSQMIALFAFAMVSVGLAAPGAMSHHIEISAVGLFFSIFFGAISSALILIKLVLGAKSMLQYGIKKESTASLWIMIPILTLLGIAMVRISFGLVHNFNSPPSYSMLFILTSIIVSLQLMTGIVGYVVMKKVGYFDEYLYGKGKSVGSYALICPGVAFFVFGMFFIFFGLQKNGIVEIFSPAYFVIFAPFVYVQFKTIKTLFILNNKLLKS